MAANLYRISKLALYLDIKIFHYPVLPHTSLSIHALGQSGWCRHIPSNVPCELLFYYSNFLSAIFFCLKCSLLFRTYLHEEHISAPLPSRSPPWSLFCLVISFWQHSSFILLFWLWGDSTFYFHILKAHILFPHSLCTNLDTEMGPLALFVSPNYLTQSLS